MSVDSLFDLLYTLDAFLKRSKLYQLSIFGKSMCAIFSFLADLDSHSG